MGHRVTIEGSHYMPTDLLGRGQRATVEVTDTIRQLVASGGATVVSGSLDDPDAVAYGEPVDERTDTEREADEQAEQSRAEIAAAGDPPKRNASREDWAEFLAQHPAGFVTEGKDRDALIAEWDEAQASGES
ncbi:hypothetical protein JVX93_16050 [Mycolicibacterium boenickei]|nr:hypothetical protein JVX93_16050 [Mycolicibacterium boenickei]